MTTLLVSGYALVALFTLAGFIAIDRESVAANPIGAIIISVCWPLFWAAAAFFSLAALIGFAISYMFGWDEED